MEKYLSTYLYFPQVKMKLLSTSSHVVILSDGYLNMSKPNIEESRIAADISSSMEDNSFSTLFFFPFCKYLTILWY